MRVFKLLVALGISPTALGIIHWQSGDVEGNKIHSSVSPSSGVDDTQSGRLENLHLSPSGKLPELHAGCTYTDITRKAHQSVQQRDEQQRDEQHGYDSGIFDFLDTMCMLATGEKCQRISNMEDVSLDDSFDGSLSPEVDHEGTFEKMAEQLCNTGVDILCDQTVNKRASLDVIDQELGKEASAAAPTMLHITDEHLTMGQRIPFPVTVADSFVMATGTVVNTSPIVVRATADLGVGVAEAVATVLQTSPVILEATNKFLSRTQSTKITFDPPLATALVQKRVQGGNRTSATTSTFNAFHTSIDTSASTQKIFAFEKLSTFGGGSRAAATLSIVGDVATVTGNIMNQSVSAVISVISESPAVVAFSYVVGTYSGVKTVMREIEPSSKEGWVESERVKDRNIHEARQAPTSAGTLTPFSSSTVAQSSPPAEITKVVTTTITIGQADCITSNRNLGLKIAANGLDSPFMAVTRTLNGSTAVVAPPERQGTVFPINTDPEFLGDLLRFSLDSDKLNSNYANVFGSDLLQMRSQNASLDWDGVGRLALILSKHREELDMETAVKHAVAFQIERPENLPVERRASVQTTAAPTATVAVYNGTTIPITDAKQTEGNAVFVMANHPPFDIHAAAMQTPVGKPPACVKHKHSKECRVQRCMLRHHAPINITTVFPAVLKRDLPPYGVDIGYFTHKTSLTRAHWGTTASEQTYWPFGLKVTTTGKHHTPTLTAVRTTPSAVHRLVGFWANRHTARAPKCWDQETCCHLCAKHPNDGQGFFRWNNWHMWGALAAAVMLGLLASLIACFMGLLARGRRRRQKDPKLSRWQALPLIGRAFRDEKVDPDAGNAVEPAVTQILTETVAVPVAVADGAAQGLSQGSAGDGRGTLGRQAEEGRGRVNFADQGSGPGQESVQSAAGDATKTSTVMQDGQQAGGDQSLQNAGSSSLADHPATTTAVAEPSSTVTQAPGTTTTATGHETAPQVQPTTTSPVQPGSQVQNVDGAADVQSGSEVYDLGSLRGRKRNRKDGKGPGFLNSP